MTPAARRVALVTGGNRGLGFEVTRQLSALGYRVLLGARDLDAGRSAAAAIDQSTVTAIRLEVTSDADVANCRALIERDYGVLDVLVNNAAIHYDTGQTPLTADMPILREALETNLIGAWRVAQMAAGLMRRQRRGRMVNVSSQAGALSELRVGAPAYRITKVALNALTLMLAEELRGSGVLVNAVCPGWVATDMGGPGGRSVAEGATGIVWAATLPDDGPTGGFFRDGQPLAW